LDRRDPHSLLLGHGWWMTHLAPRGPATRALRRARSPRLRFPGAAGAALLWRWTHAVPSLPADMPRWERLRAASHYGLYLSDVRVDADRLGAGRHVPHAVDKDAFGIPVPSIYTSQDRAMHELFEQWHMMLSYALAVCVCMISAALRHHFIKHTT
jgi:cytochrome b561